MQNEKSQALHLALNFNSILSSEADAILSVLLRKFQDSQMTNMEYYLTLFRLLLGEFAFQHAEEFVGILEIGDKQSKKLLFDVD